MHPNIEKVLIDEKTLKTRIAEMAAEISKDKEHLVFILWGG